MKELKVKELAKELFKTYSIKEIKNELSEKFNFKEGIDYSNYNDLRKNYTKKELSLILAEKIYN